MARHYEMDMTEGPLFSKIVRFAMPLMLTSILQLLYNAADIVVVGRFASSTALAAVSSTGALTNLLVGLFMGLSLGTSVAVGQAYGAGSYKDVSETVHTSITLAILCGALVTALGIGFAKPILRLMDTPEEVIELSTLYAMLYFSGSIFNLVYNFGAGILRAVGDTKRPLYYLMLSGAVNVVLNLIFVIVFHMSVAGVALATVISQVLSAVLVVICLMRDHGAVRLNPRKLRLHKDKVLRVIKVGLPAGIQASMFSISNVLIQSSINSFGAAAMAGNGAAANIEGFASVGMDAFNSATLSFTSQNLGAKKYDRLGRITFTSLIIVSCIGLTIGVALRIFGAPLIGIYTSEPEVIRMGLIRNNITTLFYPIIGMQSTFVCCMRGMGNAVRTMIISLLGICVFRVLWLATAFAAFPIIEVVFWSYPLSWCLTCVAQAVCYFITKRQIIRKAKEA